MLTRGRAPQNGHTPLHMAAYNGHTEVVKLLVQADADKNAPDKVKEGRGGDVGCTNGVCVSYWGLQRGCRLAACCRGLVDRAIVNGRGSRWLTSAPGAVWRGLVSRVALHTRECRIKSIDSGRTPHYLDRRDICF